MTRPETFRSVEEWYRECTNAVGKIPIIIAANKTDMAGERKVPFNDGITLAERLRCGYIETSAKDASNVKEAFSMIALMVTIGNGP